MFRQLRELQQSVAALATGFDAGSLLPSQAAQAARVWAQIEASAASVKALAAARAAETDSWKNQGYRSAADQLAQETGISAASARRAVEAGQRMASQPEVAQRALAGELSFEKASAVAEGAQADPAKTAELLDAAREKSLGELNEQVAKVKAARCDLEARRRAIHSRRSLKRWTDRDGAHHAHLYGNPEDGIALARVIDPVRRRLIMSRRGQTPNQALTAVDHDALMAIAAVAAGQDGELSAQDLIDLGLFPQLRHHPPAGDPAAPTGESQAASTLSMPDHSSKPARPKKLAGSPVRLMIRVDLDTLLRGVPLEGELCEIGGYGPVPVSLINELAANGNTFIVAVLTRGHEIIGVHSHRRRPNRDQKTALDFLSPTCAVNGCNTRDGIQYDHRVDWAKTHFTVYDLLDRLCKHHHSLKTRHRWALVAGTGKRDFVPPTDPRHPDHTSPQHQPVGPGP